MDASYEELLILRKQKFRELQEMQRDMEVTDYPYIISSSKQFKVVTMLQRNGVWKGDHVYISSHLSPKEQKSLFKFGKKYAKKFKVRYPDTSASSTVNPNPDSCSDSVSGGAVEKGESNDGVNCTLEGVVGGAMEKGGSECMIKEVILSNDAGNSILMGLEQGGADEKGESECRIKEEFLSDDAGNSIPKGLEQGGAVEKGSECSIKEVVLSNDAGNSILMGLEQGGAVEKGESECAIKEVALSNDAGNNILKGLEEGGAVEEEESEDRIKDVGNSVFKGLEQGLNLGEVGHEASEDTCEKYLKERNSQPSPSLSVSLLPSQSVGTDLEEVKGGSSILCMDEACQQIVATAEIVKEMKASFKEIQEMQKQMKMTLAAPFAEEGRKLEEAISQCVDKATRANGDVLLARIQENMAKHEHMTRDQIQWMIGWLNNLVNKDFLHVSERLLKKELAIVCTNITSAVSTTIRKNIPSAIIDSVQRGVSDNVADQLEKLISSKIEATLATQIQAQFKSSGKKTFQDGLKFCFKTIVIPALERTSKAMFEQFDVVFQKEIVRHAQAAAHQVDKKHYQSALDLMATLDYTSFLSQALSREMADGQRKLLALALQEPVDPTIELSRLIAEQKYEEAFASALQRSNVSIVSWLCSQVDLQRMLCIVPVPLSQEILLCLLHQLACDISEDTIRKLAWMTDVASFILLQDRMTAAHARPILEQVYQILNHQHSLPSTSPAKTSSLRVIMLIINSMLRTCKCCH